MKLPTFDQTKTVLVIGAVGLAAYAIYRAVKTGESAYESVKDTVSGPASSFWGWFTGQTAANAVKNTASDVTNYVRDVYNGTPRTAPEAPDVARETMLQLRNEERRRESESVEPMLFDPLGNSTGYLGAEFSNAGRTFQFAQSYSPEPFAIGDATPSIGVEEVV